MTTLEAVLLFTILALLYRLGGREIVLHARATSLIAVFIFAQLGQYFIFDVQSDLLRFAHSMSNRGARIIKVALPQPASALVESYAKLAAFGVEVIEEKGIGEIADGGENRPDWVVISSGGSNVEAAGAEKVEETVERGLNVIYCLSGSMEPAGVVHLKQAFGISIRPGFVCQSIMGWEDDNIGHGLMDVASKTDSGQRVFLRDVVPLEIDRGRKYQILVEADGRTWLDENNDFKRQRKERDGKGLPLVFLSVPERGGIGRILFIASDYLMMDERSVLKQADFICEMLRRSASPRDGGRKAAENACSLSIRGAGNDIPRRVGDDERLTIMVENPGTEKREMPLILMRMPCEFKCVDVEGCRSIDYGSDVCLMMKKRMLEPGEKRQSVVMLRRGEDWRHAQLMKFSDRYYVEGYVSWFKDGLEVGEKKRFRIQCSPRLLLDRI